MSNSAPAATRTSRPGWRDPRILLGVSVMAVSVLLGTWVMSSSDHSVVVLALRRDLPAGATVTATDLQSERVRFSDGAVADRYLSGVKDLPSDATAERSLHRGELLARSAVAAAARKSVLEVPLGVDADDLPVTVGAGSVVDVWVVPDHAQVATDAGKGRLVFARVTVLKVTSRSESLAPDAVRQVIITIPDTGQGQIAAALGRAASGHLVLLRRG